MDKEFAERWVTALRSGDYQQGRNALRNTTDHGTFTYCCLGVACDLFNPHWTNGDWESLETYSGNYDDDNGEPIHFDGEVVLYEAGHDGEFPFLSSARDVQTLITMNDSIEASFTEIADWIEANLINDQRMFNG